MRAALSSLVVLLLAGLHPSGSAGAQESSSDTVAVPLPPVVVTVLRTPIEVGRAPLAISVNDATRIRRGQPGVGLDEALRGIPGVQVDSRMNWAVGDRIAVRGFGARAQFGVRGVRVLVDGIPATLPDGQTALSHVDLATVRRVEVIRGPASALYGNTAGGVIQLETAQPPAAALGQEVGLLAGSGGLLRLHSATGGRSGGTGYLLNLSRLRVDGHREFSAARNTFVSGRLGHERERDRVRLHFSGVDLEAENPGSLTARLVGEDRRQAFANNLRQRTGKTAREGQLGATWERRLAGGGLEATAYAISRSVVNPIPNAIIDLGRRAMGARAVARGGEGGRVRFALGAEVDRQRDDRRNRANVLGEAGELTLDQLEHVTNVAAFGQLTAAPLPPLTVLAGLRYDAFDFSVADRLVSVANPDDSGRRSMNALSPSLGATLEVRPWVSLYGNVATSFETPTTTELANRPGGAGGFNPDLQPQRAISYEAGLRGRRAAWVAYQLAAYHARVRDALIPFEVAEAPGRQFFRNAGTAIHRGVEAAATLAIRPGVRVDAAYTYTDARFGEHVTGGGDLAGNRVPGVAPHRLDLAVALEPGGGWFLVAEGRYVDTIPVDDANSAVSPAHRLAELRVGHAAVPLGALRLAPVAGVTNLLGESYNAGVAVNAFGRRFFEPGPGRSVFVGLSARL